MSSINIKIREYKAANPELSRLSDIEVAGKMLAKGLITQKEFESLPQMMSNSANLGVTDDFVSTTKQPSVMSVPKPKTHPQVPEILLDENGRIDLKQFELEALQKKYPKDKYDIKEMDVGIFIEDKSNHHLVLSVNRYRENADTENINVSKPAIYGKDEFVPGYSYSIRNAKFIRPYVTSSTHLNKDGEVIKRFDDAGLTHITETDSNGRIKNFTRCLDNPPTEMIKDGDMRFINELKGVLSVTGADEGWKMSLFSEYPSLMQLSRGNNFLKQYRDKTNSNYYDDLMKFGGHDFTHKEFCSFAAQRFSMAKELKSAQETYNGAKLPPYYEYCKQVIDDYDNEIVLLLKNKISENSGTDVNGIICDNPLGMADLLRKYPEMINDVARSSMSDVAKRNIIRSILLPFSSTERSDDVMQIIMNSNLEPLLKGENDELLNKIKNAQNPEQKNRLAIDLLRHSSKKVRNFVAFGNNKIDVPKTPANGKIDLPFKQGITGDCWLIAGVMSIKDRPKGEDYLNSLLSYDAKNKTVTVNLKGVDKSYTISQDEIDAATDFAKDEGDLRAIEIAIDRYVADMAKEGKEKAIDIHGNQMEFVYKVLLGNGKTDIKGDQFFANDKNKYNVTERNYDAVIPDFNNPKKVYTFAFNKPNPFRKDIDDFDNKKVDEVGSDKQQKLYSNHAYAIVKSDNQFVYFRNPHDSTKMYKIDIEFFKRFTAEVQSADLNF